MIIESLDKCNTKYSVILSDPPWGEYFDQRRSRGGCENHYPTMKLQDICDLPVDNITNNNSVLFLWTTSPYLMKSNQVIESWGFAYKSSFIWDKQKHNMGWYNSVRHELLLISTKGSYTPRVKKLFDSVQSIPRTKHSEKPEEFRTIIDTLYPNENRLELFARKEVENWDSWGNQIKVVNHDSEISFAV